VCADGAKPYDVEATPADDAESGEDGGVYNHEPPDYRCPFCRNIAFGESDLPFEVLHRDDDVFVKMNPKWWHRNPGGVLVIPVDHHENVYDLPPELGTPIQRAVRSVALAMKTAFGCAGVSTRQHNEPAGYQDVWHYHVHVFPRWEGDDLYRSDSGPAAPGELRLRAAQLRDAWPTG
jgi:histidine triad (HIT) family protein